MEKLLDTDVPKCECGADALVYRGLGQFYCTACRRTVLNNYGKVYEYVENHPNASVDEVSRATGVRDYLIADLVSEHRIVAVGDPRLNITCVECGAAILVGDRCEDCRRRRMEKLSQRGRQLFNGEEEPKRQKFIGTAAGPKSGQVGKMRFDRNGR